MTTVTRLGLAGAAAVVVLCVAGPAQAGAVRADFQPHAVSGVTLLDGADGQEHTLMCPPDENVLGGGFTVSAPAGRELSRTPSDVLSSQPTADATGWTVAVRKDLVPSGPAALTIQIVCTEGEVTPGG